MPVLALVLVLTAAVTHAVWNLMAKRASASRHFVWLYSALAVLLWTPVVFMLDPPTPSGLILVALLGTAVLHLAYSLALQHAYAVADLSVVYPIIRGSGPLLAFIGAAVVLHEPVSVSSVVGALLVVVGVLLLAGPRSAGRGLAVGLGTGALVASYTVWDGWAVKTLLLAPVLVDYAGNLLRVVALAPRAWRDRGALRGEARTYRASILAVAVLGPLGYILVLSAMQIAPVSHVAPARELSMLVGAWLGARVLDEGHLARRLAASVLVVAGVLALAFG